MLKIIKNNHSRWLVYTTSNEINKHKLMMYKSQKDLFTRLVIKKTENSNSLNYDISEYIDAETFFRGSSNHFRDFLLLIKKACDFHEKCISCLLSLDSFLYDTENIFIDNIKKEIKFIYLPIKFSQKKTRIQDFIKKIYEISKNVSPEIEEKFENILNYLNSEFFCISGLNALIQKTLGSYSEIYTNNSSKLNTNDINISTKNKELDSRKIPKSVSFDDKIENFDEKKIESDIKLQKSKKSRVLVIGEKDKIKQKEKDNKIKKSELKLDKFKALSKRSKGFLLFQISFIIISSILLIYLYLSKIQIINIFAIFMIACAINVLISKNLFVEFLNVEINEVLLVFKKNKEIKKAIKKDENYDVFKIDLENEMMENTDFDKTEMLFSSKLYLKDISKNENYKVDKRKFIIGRKEEEVDVYLDNSKVSRLHAKIFNDNDEYYISDLQSSNGTYLNGKRLKNKEKYLLANSDIIKFADTKFLVEKLAS